ncbi:MAG: T9SS type A sorting domain-containing protein [Lewinellaceae bacterium]|nr:T9SS type A sorting domain-containing protein [Lewinellaceae bacterium]
MQCITSDGTPDLSFGVNGKVTTLIGDKPSKAYSVALLNNGKFLVGGTVTNDNGYEDFFLSRFFSNGNPDSSFGQNGALITDFQNSRDEARAMAVQADGQVVLSGFGGKRETNDFALRRLNPDGSFDNAFGNAGTVLTDFDFKDDRLTSIALKPDGRILAAGYSTSSNMGNDYAFIQYLSDGQLDPDFGDAGKKTINLGTSFERANAVSIQPDGKIIAAGSKQHQNISQYYHSIVMRLNSAGNPDPTFNQTGFMVDSTFQLDETRAVRLQPDGKIITAGSGRMSMSERTDFIVRRYNANGTPDYFFSADGMVTSDINNRWDYANALALQPDGKILVAGQSEQALDAQLALLRYNSDGSPDNSFGTSGQAPSSTGSVSSIALQPDGKILTGGNADGDFRLTRFLSNGNLDNSFGINGAVSTDFAGNFDQINALALQPDGKIIAAGTIKTDLFYRMAVARYLSDGTLDDNFGDKGKVVVSQDVSDGFATSVALQPDGKIVVGGYLDAQPSYDFALLRYLTDLNVGVVDNNSDDHMVLIYPNPVGHFAQLKYTLRERTQVSIELYDLQGRMLKTFIQAESRDAGEHEEQLEMPVDMAAGAYFLSIKTPLGVRTVKIIR